MKESGRLVSVVTICRNMDAELRETARSVLRQRDVDMEYLVVDGASSDNTMSVIRDIEVECRARNISFIWSSEPDDGIYDAMNKGIRRATGEWIVFMNAGDRFASDHALADLLAAPGAEAADLLYGTTILERDFGRVVVNPRPLSRLQRKMAFCHQSMAVRMSLMKEHPFDTRFPVCADFEFVHWCYVSRKILKESQATVAVFDGTKGNSRKLRLQLDRECAIITGRNRTLSWKVQHALKVVEVGFNHVVRSVMPRSLTDNMRKRVYYKKTGQKMENDK